MQTSGQMTNVGRSPPIADPIDMVQGHFLYEHEDISVGVGGFPQSLAFRRLYSSGLRNQNGPLGKGWTHNFSASAIVNSDGFQAMGEDSALDAVGALVEHKASFDLLMDSTRPLFKLVAAAIGQRWFGDQLINNTVVLTQGLNGEIFVKLPDGSYNPPPGKPVKLTKNTDGSYSYESLHRAVLKFNTAGKPESYTEPGGIQVKYSYSGNALTQVQNSLGRTLSFTNASGRITQVSDGTRSVGYGYDSASNLGTFTNTLGQASTFSYGLPVQITRVYYPNPADNVQFGYDLRGLRTSAQFANGSHAISYAWDNAARLVSTTAGGRTLSHNYDAAGNRIRTTWPDGFFVATSYDAARAADAAAQEAGYDDAHDAKKGRGDSRVNIYNDKTTGQKWIWDGKKGSGKEQL